MKSIKPGRGPSGLSFMGSIYGIIFGVFWTIIAANVTSGSSFGIIFPLFGVLVIIMSIVQAVYHYRNTTGKNRYSMFDITDSTEESDPASKWIKDELNDVRETNYYESSSEKASYCPYCGDKLEDDYRFCPSCGKSI